MTPKRQRIAVDVEGRAITLSNLDKPLYPTGFTKGEVIDYYARIAPVMLPYLTDRPVTVKRFPEGTAEGGFIEKNVPSHAPVWVRTVELERKGPSSSKRSSRRNDATTEFVVVDDLPTLMWLANLAAVELHTPQWRVDREGRARDPDLIVFDLDPGEPATAVECCEVALRLRARAAEDGIELCAKTSGSKGIQCYGSLRRRRWSADRPSEYAHSVAEELEAADPDLVVSKMTKSLRKAKVFVDWSQNNPAKTTVTPYSLRALDRPTVSTPVTWDEVSDGADGRVDLLAFTPDEVLSRVDELGDLFDPLRR